MSLRVWLPLTKDLRNQGLDDVTVTNNGAMFNSSGKLGGCYSFGTGNSYITVDSTPLKTFTEFSFACWVKIISWNTAYSTIFAAKNSTGISWDNLIFSLLRNSSNSTLCFNIAGSGGYTSTSCQTGTLSLNTWYHITCTYKSGEIKLYQDGNVVSTYNTSIVPSFSSIVNLWIGKSNESSYQSNNLLNDVRIYDHCLSPMEVKELSKGLVLHYPLNRGGWGQENLFNWSNNATGITLNDYQNRGSFTQFTNSLTFDPSTTVGKKYTISFWAKSPNGMTSLLLYNNNGKPKYFNFSSTTLTNNLGIEWQFFKYTVTNTQYTGSDANTNTNTWKRIEIYAPNQMKVQVKQIKVEEGEIATPWCPNSSDALATTMGLNRTTEYDTSGYCNNGTRTGTFSWTSDTPKYQVSQYFNNPTGTSTLSDKIYISASPNLYSPSAITVGFWFKKEAITRGGLFTTGLATTSTTTLAIHDYDSSVKVISSDNTTLSMGSYDTFIPSTNIWYHYVITFDGINAKIYINGDLKTTKSYSGTKTLQNIIDITLGANSAGGVYRSAKGYYSDFRIYTTALSADDVKSLYQNSAYIDSSGNVYGTIHES